MQIPILLNYFTTLFVSHQYAKQTTNWCVRESGKTNMISSVSEFVVLQVHISLHGSLKKKNTFENQFRDLNPQQSNQQMAAHGRKKVPLCGNLHKTTGIRKQLPWAQRLESLIMGKQSLHAKWDEKLDVATRCWYQSAPVCLSPDGWSAPLCIITCVLNSGKNKR